MWKIAFCVCAYLSVTTARADLRAVLQIRPNVHTVREGTRVSISCGAQDSRKLEWIEMEFGRQEKLKWEDSDEDRLSYSIANGTSQKLHLTRRTVSLPFNYSLLKGDLSPLRLSVNLTARFSHSGIVNCSVKSVYDPIYSTWPQRKEASHALNVEWPPTVRQLLVQPPSPKEGDSVNVSCIFDRGHPEREVSDPRPVGILRGQPRAVPAPGGRLRLSWVWRVRREENGAEVGCRLDNGSNKKQRLVVIYAPTITNSLPSSEAKVVSAELPLPVRLDMGESPLTVKEQRIISCRPESADVDLGYLKLSLSTHNVDVQTNKDSLPRFRSKSRSWTTASYFPFTTYREDTGVTVLRPTSGQIIRVTLTPTPRHDGCIVTCTGASVPNKGKKGEVMKTIRVHWPPSVRRVIVHGSDGPSSSVTAHKPATIRCELQKGREGTASVTATVGGRDIGAPQSIIDLEKDEDGYQWKAAVWSHEFRRDDNGRSVVCRIEDGDEKSVTVDVQWKPRSLTFSPAHETFAGEFVNCSADGNALPVVRIEGFGRTARGVSIASLSVPTTAKGEYQVKCIAENSVGTESKTASITAQKKYLPTDFLVLQINQDLGSTISLCCGPRSLKDGVSSVNLTFTGEQQVIWKAGKIKDNQLWIQRHHFNEVSKILCVDVLASPFMKGTVRCQLESADHSSVGGEETQITLRWRAQFQRIFTRIENRTERGRMIEGDTLTVTCEVEVGSPPTKEQVQFEGLNMNGRRTIGDDLRNHDGWTLRNESTQVRLSWRHDGESIGCWLGGKKLTKRLEVEYAPRNLSIDPLSVGPGHAVRCSAGGRPTPTVSIRVTDPRLGWKLKSGDGQVELVVGRKDKSGNFIVVCEAENVHGKDSTKAVVIVKNSFDIVGLVTSAVFNVLLLLTVVILGIFLVRMRRQTSSITRPTHTTELDGIQPISNIYNTDEEQELFGTPANHSRPSERFESAANCPESENAYEDVIQQLQNRLKD